MSPLASIAITALSLAIAAPSSQQGPPLSLPWPIATSRAGMAEDAESGYLKVLMGLLDRASEVTAESRVRPTFLDVLATSFAYVGEEGRALESGDAAFPRVQPGFQSEKEQEDFLAAVHPVPAIQAIVAASHGRRAVMINEEHRSSRQRGLAHELLGPLREAGFTHLALETLFEDSLVLAERGYPIMTSGIYTRDPVLGDLVRRALELGFTVVGYEAPTSDRRPRPDDTSPLDAINRREAGQARILYERTLASDPKARVLVYAGRDHIAEQEADGWTPMGMLFAKLADTDPLSINLISMTEHSKPELERREYRAVDAAGWLDSEPVVLKGEGGEIWSDAPGTFDAHVFLPRQESAHGRPTWARLGGTRVSVSLEAPVKDAPLLLQAFFAGEKEHPVPADQCVAWPGKPTPRLFLRPGRYLLRALDRHGKVLHEQMRQVEH